MRFINVVPIASLLLSACALEVEPDATSEVDVVEQGLAESSVPDSIEVEDTTNDNVGAEAYTRHGHVFRVSLVSGGANFRITNNSDAPLALGQFGSVQLRMNCGPGQVGDIGFPLSAIAAGDSKAWQRQCPGGSTPSSSSLFVDDLESTASDVGYVGAGKLLSGGSMAATDSFSDGVAVRLSGRPTSSDPGDLTVSADLRKQFADVRGKVVNYTSRTQSGTLVLKLACWNGSKYTNPAPKSVPFTVAPGQDFPATLKCPQGSSPDSGTARIEVP